jgi:prepilin-type N-terminal cleavage/methylation domain-containing protein
MISAARTNKSVRGGFTLLEIVMVLAIGSVLMGAAFGFMIYSSDDRVLGNTSGEIEAMAKRARITSILHQTPYALEFREGIVRMTPLALAGLDEKSLASNSSGNDHRQLSLDSGMTLMIRRWNSDKWLPVGKNNIHVWRFDPDGLCEPISLRLAFGKSWTEDTFHPLTAASIIAEKKSEIR